MKKFILIVLVIILSKLSFACADSPKATWNDNFIGTQTFSPHPTRIKCELIKTGNTPIMNRLKDLAGKIIYRDVPAQSETEYDEAYQNEPYKLIYYNENVIQIQSIPFQGKNNKFFGDKIYTLSRDLWDDGNWKEWKAWKETGLGFTFGKPSSIIYNTTFNLEQWDHVYLNFNRPGIKMTWTECGQILMFYNISGESCFNHAVVRLCTKYHNKYRIHPFPPRDIISYQKVDWLQKDTKCLFEELSK